MTALILVFRKEEYEKCFEHLGIKKIRILAEDFYSPLIEINVLENVVGVWATPSNTNSSVLDPVDLAITRGGDLQILQQLTEEIYSQTPTDVNINDLLWEQKETLRHSMSKPQVF